MLQRLAHLRQQLRGDHGIMDDPDPLARQTGSQGEIVSHPFGDGHHRIGSGIKAPYQERHQEAVAAVPEMARFV